MGAVIWTVCSRTDTICEFISVPRRTGGGEHRGSRRGRSVAECADTEKCPRGAALRRLCEAKDDGMKIKEHCPRQRSSFVLARELPLLDEGPGCLGPELFGSSGRRRHGASVKDRDGVPQKGPPREQSRCRMLHG